MIFYLPRLNPKFVKNTILKIGFVQWEDDGEISWSLGEWISGEMFCKSDTLIKNLKIKRIEQNQIPR